MPARREADIPMSSAAIFALLLIAYPACALAEAPKTCAAPPTSTLTVDVKDKGAKGDGKTDDTAAIQSAIDDVAGANGTVFVPDGIYMVDAVRGKSLRLGSDMTLKLADNAVLKAFPNKSKNYAVLTIAEASNVWVTGGTLEGERDQHKGKSGEWGMGIHIGKNAKHITISSVAAKKMWGDGFYVDNAEDVRFCSILADGNRRQGLSIIDAKRLLVAAGTPIVREQLVTSLDGARDAAKSIGYPVVLKVVSDAIPHRSDVGLVAVGLRDESELRAAWERLANPQ